MRCQFVDQSLLERGDLHLGERTVGIEDRPPESRLLVLGFVN